MSDTPRTDAKESETEHSLIYKHAHYGWKMSRSLERELAAVTAERDELHKALCDLRAECIADGWLRQRAKCRAIDDATAALCVADKRLNERLMQSAQEIIDAALRRP